MTTPPLPTSEILDRTPPHSLEAEQGVLGSILLDPRCLDTVTALVKAEDFYADANRVVYGHLVGMYAEDRRIDVLLLAERIKAKGELERIGGLDYLASVAQAVPVASHAAYYAEIVQRHSKYRSLIHAATGLLRDSYEARKEPADIVSAMDGVLLGMAPKDSTTPTPATEAILKSLDRIDKVLTSGKSLGLPTGFFTFDQAWGGLFPGELNILAARPGLGKTTLAAQIAEYAASRKRVVYFASLEMSDHELMTRMLCSASGVNHRLIRTARVTRDDLGKITVAANRMAEFPIHLHAVPDLTGLDIRRAARQLRRKQLDLVVVDYLQLVTPENHKDGRQEQVAKVSRLLKKVAGELDVPMLVCCQLNRQAEKEERPRLGQLRESGAIEQDADVVMFLHAEEADPRDATVKVKWLVEKYRNGERGEVDLLFDRTRARFVDPNTAINDSGDFEEFR